MKDKDNYRCDYMPEPEFLVKRNSADYGDEKKKDQDARIIMARGLNCHVHKLRTTE